MQVDRRRPIVHEAKAFLSSYDYKWIEKQTGCYLPQHRRWWPTGIQNYNGEVLIFVVTFLRDVGYSRDHYWDLPVIVCRIVQQQSITGRTWSAYFPQSKECRMVMKHRRHVQNEMLVRLQVTTRAQYASKRYTFIFMFCMLSRNKPSDNFTVCYRYALKGLRQRSDHHKHRKYWTKAMLVHHLVEQRGMNQYLLPKRWSVVPVQFQKIPHHFFDLHGEHRGQHRLRRCPKSKLFLTSMQRLLPLTNPSWRWASRQRQLRIMHGHEIRTWSQKLVVENSVARVPKRELHVLFERLRSM